MLSPAYPPKVDAVETGSFQLPLLSGTESQIQVDGPTFTSLLGGIDFTVSRRGWYRKNGQDPARLGIDSDPEL